MARGSDGSGEERYIAYLPFEIAVGATLAAPFQFTAAGSTVHLERLEPLYAVTCGSFATAEVEACEKDSLAWREIDNLLSRVADLKRRAVNAALRKFLSEVATRHEELGDPDQVVKTVANIYATRNLLVRTGKADDTAVSAGLEYLSHFVPRLLRLFLEKSAM
jgi:hypothetical protein